VSSGKCILTREIQVELLIGRQFLGVVIPGSNQECIIVNSKRDQSGCGEQPERAFVRNVSHHSAVTPASAEAGDESSSALSFGGASQHVHGDVAMDVTLNDDGTVQEVKVIEGNPLLNSAATDAVKQWKYRPLTVHGKLVNRVVVVLTFDKNGKVR
jgi:TonB family protein